MNNEEIISKLKDLLCKKLDIDIETDEFNESTRLIEYGFGVDSVSVMEFIVVLENEFGIEIDESEIEPAIFNTMNSLAVYVSKRLK